MCVYFKSKGVSLQVPLAIQQPPQN